MHRGFFLYLCFFFFIVSYDLQSMFYVVSPKDIVVAKPRDLDDHISWLLQNERYPEALEAARGNERHIRSHKLIAIGEVYAL